MEEKDLLMIVEIFNKLQKSMVNSENRTDDDIADNEENFEDDVDDNIADNDEDLEDDDADDDISTNEEDLEDDEEVRSNDDNYYELLTNILFVILQLK